MKKLSKRQRRWIAAGAVLLALLAAALDARLLVRQYTVEFEKGVRGVNAYAHLDFYYDV